MMKNPEQPTSVAVVLVTHPVIVRGASAKLIANIQGFTKLFIISLPILFPLLRSPLLLEVELLKPAGEEFSRQLNE